MKATTTILFFMVYPPSWSRLGAAHTRMIQPQTTEAKNTTSVDDTDPKLALHKNTCPVI